MEGRVDRNLQHLEIELPQPAGAVGNYAPFVVSGQFVHVSGKLPVWNGALRHVGKLGDALGINDG